jgi:hypothetical protein
MSSPPMWQKMADCKGPVLIYMRTAGEDAFIAGHWRVVAW